MSEQGMEHLLKLVARLAQQQEETAQRVQQVESAAKRRRNEDEADEQEVVPGDDWHEELCAAHGLAEGASVIELVRTMGEKLAALEQKERDHLWLKRQSTQEVANANAERDSANSALFESRKRQEMDREYLGNLQQSIVDLRTERDALKAELETRRSKDGTVDVETQRELARLRREVDTMRADREREHKQHADAHVQAMQENQAAIEVERARTTRHDALNQKAMNQLKQQFGAQQARLADVEKMYGQVLAQRLMGARQLTEQAIGKAKVAAGGEIPADVMFYLDAALHVLDLSTLGNSSQIPLPVSVVQFTAAPPPSQPAADHNPRGNPQIPTSPATVSSIHRHASPAYHTGDEWD